MQDRLARLGIAIGCALVAALLAVGAVGLLGAALYQALLPIVPPPLAAVLTAVAALLLAAIVMLIGRGIAARPARTYARSGIGAVAPGRMGLVGSLGQEMGLDAGDLLRTHARKVIVAALVGGFAVGVSPRLRRFLWRLMQ